LCLLTYQYDRVKSPIERGIGGVVEFIGANEIYYRIRLIDRYKKALTEVMAACFLRKNGADCRNRTGDLLITSQLLGGEKVFNTLVCSGVTVLKYNN
jgi:hypothetical protein